MHPRNFHVLSQKLRLENLIYARAYTLRAPIYACRGKLKTPCWEPGLQIALYIYNCAYSAANARLCPEEVSFTFSNELGGIKNGWILPVFNKKNLDKTTLSML